MADRTLGDEIRATAKFTAFVAEKKVLDGWAARADELEGLLETTGMREDENMAALERVARERDDLRAELERAKGLLAQSERDVRDLRKDAL